MDEGRDVDDDPFGMDAFMAEREEKLKKAQEQQVRWRGEEERKGEQRGAHLE